MIMRETIIYIRRQNQSTIVGLTGRRQLMHFFSSTTWSPKNYLTNNPILEAGSALDKIVTLCKTNEKYFADASMSGILWGKKIDIQTELPYISKEGSNVSLKNISDID